MKPNQNVEACAQSTDQSPRLLWAVKWMWLIPEEFRCSKKVTDFLAFHIRNSTFRCGSMTPKITWYQSTGAFSLLHYKDPQTHFDWHPIFVTSQGLWTQVTQGIWGEEYGYIGSCVRQLAEVATVPISSYRISAFSSKTTLLPGLTQ